MLRHLAVITGSILGSILLGVPLWIATHRVDLPAPDDADLAQVSPPLAAEQNGFEHFRAAAETAQGLREGDTEERLRAMRRREASEPKWISELVRRNERAFAALEQALAAPGFQLPALVLANDLDETAGVLTNVQQLVKLAATDAQLRLRSGNREGAFDRALFGMRVGHRLSEADGAHLLSTMVAVSSQGISLAEVEALLRETTLSLTEAKALAARVGSYRLPADGWMRTFATEYRYVKVALLKANEVAPSEDPALIDDESRESSILRWLPADYVWQPNRTLSAFAAFYREEQQGVARDCRQLVLRRQTRDVSAGNLLSLVLMPNATGRVVIDLSTPNLERFALRRCHAETKISLVQVLIAMRAYLQVEATLPERLDELVPDYLDAVPIDAFDGLPLRYSKADAIVYSVGDDFTDQGGFDPPSQSEIKEPTIRVAF